MKTNHSKLCDYLGISPDETDRPLTTVQTDKLACLDGVDIDLFDVEELRVIARVNKIKRNIHMLNAIMKG